MIDWFKDCMPQAFTIQLFILSPTTSRPIQTQIQPQLNPDRSIIYQLCIYDQSRTKSYKWIWYIYLSVW